MRSLARGGSGSTSTLGSSTTTSSQNSYAPDRRRKQTFVEQDVLEKTMTSIGMFIYLMFLYKVAL